MMAAQNQALTVEEARAVAAASKAHTIVIKVDHVRAASTYRAARIKIEQMLTDLSRAAEFFDKPALAAYGEAMAEWKRWVDAGDDAAAEPKKPKLKWNDVQHKLAYVKRMEALASFACAPFDMAEGQVFQLNRMENGTYFDKLEALLQEWYEARGAEATK
ncbi:IQ calmodulin-binding domain-containing family protein [Ralstonia phage GP4]|uniref:IQ calmodulin-binding domain-containing family protein n=1 Tax=Ralstonia phage GP4 TaxID=2282904 RepID=A0A345GTW0_9CAUD|nr:IQ calmodulin-binding domain-containing family protein [Ralstonia phage GP4]AXG67724.1 IQ calmodulin-binding domain-containing family protein [Ralstonia phage GP4]